MTRKEAFNNRPMLERITEVNLIDKFIKKIYDDFESRTCEHCKYLMCRDSGNVCSKSLCFAKTNTYIEITNLSFGCNKWEKKQ